MYDEYPDESHLAKPHNAQQGAQGALGAQGAATQGHASKPSWSDRLSTLGSKAAAPLNALANKMGSEGFLPSTMDKEVVKASRILKNFCKDGVYSESTQVPIEGEVSGDKKAKQPKNRTLLTIPSKVISRAVGLAIFTTGRVGFQVSGATGSGILIARLPDGSWSPPSGIQVHSLGAGFVIGVDIYDCVVIINSREALEAFKQTRMSLGSDLAVVAGPWGAGGSLDIGLPVSEGKGKEKEKNEKDTKAGAEHATSSTLYAPGTGPQPAMDPKTTETQSSTTFSAPPERKPSPFREAMSKPVYSYVKSRGFYAGVQIDGTVVTERKDANAAFYGAKVTVDQILKGQVPTGGWHGHVKELLDVVKGAEVPKDQTTTLPSTTPADGTHSMTPPAAGYYAPAGTGGHTGSYGGADVTSGVQQMHLGGPLSSHPQPPPGAPAQSSKAQEAASEAARSHSPGPPGYSEQTGTDELPPAYVDNGQPHPTDSKTGHSGS